MGEEKRHEMMETLFGAESEDSDDEPEPERQPRRVALSDQASDHFDKEGSYEGEDGGGDAELEEAESEGERGESDGERGESDGERGESDGERGESDGERGISDDGERAESEGGREELDPESEGEREEIAELSASGSERSPGPQFAEEYEEEEVQEETRVSEDEQEEPRERVEVAKARDVFGESDDEEEENQAPVRERLTPEESPERARSESPERARSGSAGAEDIVRDEEDRDRYESEDERDTQQKPEKPMGPPITIKVPLRPPPGMPDQLNIVRMSNIMNIDMKPFDPETYEAEESLTTEVEGRKQHIRLEENVVRWRPDREGNYESNARFVRWSDGSLQLLLGSEVLDLSVQNATQDQSHLFVRHHGSILQSQGQVLRKMRFMPSSLTSKSHRLLTALVDVKHKKTFKVKAVITETDPEKEKHEKEKAVQDIIRARVDLQRKQEKASSRYSSAPSRPRVVERERGLSPGYLEDALDEEDDGYDRRNSRRHREEQQLEQEQRAERRIMQAKRQAPAKPPPSRSAMNKSRRPKSDDFLDDSMSEADSDIEPSVQGSDEIVGGAWEEEDDEEEEQERRLPSSSRGGSTRDMDSRYNGEDDTRKRKKDHVREERSPSPAKKLSRRRVVVSDSDDD